MGILSRISIIVRSYLSTAESRMERIAAEEELKLAKTRQDAQEELESALSDLRKPISTEIKPLQKLRITPSRLASEYQLLGLEPGASLDAVETAWRSLASRADPKRFPSGSNEEKRAAEILKSINDAYARIREELNPTEGRFGQLEL